MSYRIAISFAAAAIGISCIANDASARGGGGGGHGGHGPMAAVSGKSYNSVKSYNTVNTKPKGKFRRAEGVGGPTGNPNAGNPGTVTSIPRTVGVGGPTGGGASMGAAYYAPASYDANFACGRYPYPPCKRVPAR
jgi:hypothetical protein